MPSDRLRCEVPFCTRTRPAGKFDAWICPDHWQNIDVMRRWAYSRMKRRKAPVEARARIWRRLVREARDRAAGI